MLKPPRQKNSMQEFYKNRCPVPLEPQIPTDTHVKVHQLNGIKKNIVIANMLMLKL